jgi:NADH dehydrogenase/NADH:ubiquinone oxidoreductase subunit G
MQMGNVNASIDGKKVRARDGLTILQVAEANGIKIPTLCHIKDLLPTGACRVCVVEVDGYRTLVGSCHTPLAEGMVIYTRSPKVTAARKVIVELMLTGHTGDCVVDTNAENCKLHNLAADYEVGAPRFNVKFPHFYPVEEMNPYVRRNMSKCILCRKCVLACSEIAQKNILSLAYRGFRSKVVTGFDDPLDNVVCRECGICIEYCPTGALTAAPGLAVKPGGKAK